jgi:hypothetical protein
VKPFGNSVVGGVFCFLFPLHFLFVRFWVAFIYVLWSGAGKDGDSLPEGELCLLGFLRCFVLMNSGVDTYGG